MGVDPGDENNVGDNCTVEPPVTLMGVSAETGEGEHYMEYTVACCWYAGSVLATNRNTCLVGKNLITLWASPIGGTISFISFSVSSISINIVF